LTSCRSICRTLESWKYIMCCSYIMNQRLNYMHCL